MRFEIVRQVFLKELRETLRDRRSLFVMFGVPLVLYPLLILATAGMAAGRVTRMERQDSPVAVVNGEAAPHLLERLQRPGSGVKVTPSTEPDGDLKAGKLQAVLVVPPEFERKALAAGDAALKIELDRSREASGAAREKLGRVIQEYQRWIVAQRLRERGVPEALARPLKTETEDVSTGDRRFGAVLATILPMMLLITGALGALYPAINAATAEREHGTLETLLVTPAGKMELLLGKVAIVLLCGLIASGLNLISMTLAMWRLMSAAAQDTQIAAISPAPLALAYLASVPAIVFLSAAILVAALHARNFREAMSYANNVFFLSMVPTFVTLADPKTSAGLLVTPLVNTTLVIRDVFNGRATPGEFALAFVSSLLYGGLMLSLAARLFTSEDLANPSWEPLSLKGLRRAARAPRLPSIDEALAVFAFSLLLVFYVQPGLLRWGLLPATALTEVLLIAAPALLLARIARYDWRRVFSLRAPGTAGLLGGLLLGLGLVPWMNALLGLQNRVWPVNPELARAMGNAFLPTLQKHPVLAPVMIGLFAGVCEELLFRGPIQTAFTRKLPRWLGVLVTALLFGIAHMYAEGIPGITLIGIVLGWVVLRTGSIVPAMIVHAVYDSVKLGLASWAVHSQGPAAAQSADFQVFGPVPPALALAAGVAMLIAGGWLCLRRGGEVGR